MTIKSVIIACDATSKSGMLAHTAGLEIQDASALKLCLANDKPTVIAVACYDDLVALHVALEACLRTYGPLTNLVRIVNPRPSIMVQSVAYEYGVDQFLSYDALPDQLTTICHNAESIFGASDSSASVVLDACKAVSSLGQAEVQSAAERLRPFAAYDYEAAYALGRVQEALSSFADAELTYRACLKLNSTFRPAAMSLAECLLVLGRSAESLEILLTLEQLEGHCNARKALIAAAYAEQKNVVEARRYAEAAAKLSAQDPRTLEAQAHVLIASGAVAEVVKIMERLSGVGPFFTVKLNELGIALSQGRKGDIALMLYEKAHAIVRPELKFKISLNAALAAHRTGNAKKALFFLDRCQREYGSSFAKLEKIRAVVRSSVANLEDAS